MMGPTPVTSQGFALVGLADAQDRALDATADDAGPPERSVAPRAAR